jgi:transketolase
LDTFAKRHSPLAEQPSPGCAAGVELATGSLGHGLPVGIGMALAGRIRSSDYRVLVVMSDGECNEGSVWEGAMFAAAQRLANLTVVIDYNKWQATGRSDEVMALPSLRQKWESFGWEACEIDGHDLAALTRALGEPMEGKNKPKAIVAHTTKGRGISFMEDDNNWHYRIPTSQEVDRAKTELKL